MRQAAGAALQCDPTRGDAEFYATIHRVVGPHKEASIAAAHRWLDFAPRSAMAHFWVGSTVAASGKMGDATVYLQKAAHLQPYATFFQTWFALGLFCTGRADAGLRHLRAILAFEPHDYLANYWLGLLASHAPDLTRRAMRPSAPIRCQAARKRSPRGGSSRRDRNLSRQPRPSCIPSHIPRDTSLIPVCARSTSRLDVLIALLENGLR